ncbi:regulatory protein GemA [Marinobacter sp. MCTG268]|uniref:gp16 family protein n=1 Tax=Marinobacter adhaerens TaxID=1033846 RepID=UPI000690984C
MTRDNRKKVTAQIHIARKQLALDEDTYRLAISTATGGKRSCADCTVPELYQVLQHMKERGFKARPRKRIAQHPGTPHNLDREPMLQKIEALLAELKAPWSYADAIAKRQYKVERVAWLRTVEQYTGVIAALDVELEKRRLLSALERHLEEQNLTIENVENQVSGLPKNWRRNRKVLARLCVHYMGPDEWLSEHRKGADA